MDQGKMSKNAISTLPLPKFEGEQEKFGMYNTQMKLYLSVKRWEESWIRSSEASFQKRKT